MSETHSQKWHYADANKQAIGPFSIEDLLKLRAAGIVHDQTLVFVEGGSEWKPIGAIWPTVPPPPLAKSVQNAVSSTPPTKPTPRSENISTLSGCLAIMIAIIAGVAILHSCDETKSPGEKVTVPAIVADHELDEHGFRKPELRVPFKLKFKAPVPRPEPKPWLYVEGTPENPVITFNYSAEPFGHEVNREEEEKVEQLDEAIAKVSGKPYKRNAGALDAYATFQVVQDDVQKSADSIKREIWRSAKAGAKSITVKGTITIPNQVTPKIVDVTLDASSVESIKQLFPSEKSFMENCPVFKNLGTEMSY